MRHGARTAPTTPANAPSRSPRRTTDGAGRPHPCPDGPTPAAPPPRSPYGRGMVTADDARRVALSLPATVEKLSWGMPTFRAGPAGRIFAALEGDDEVMGVKCPKEDREELIAAEPHKFFLRHGHDEPYAWLRVRLAALDDEAELRAVLVDSWRQAAPARLRAAHPELDPPPPGA